MAFEYATNVIRDARDAESATGLQVLATIPASRTAGAVVNRTSTDARRAAERYRMLRTAFGIATKDTPLRSVLVSAPAQHSGSTDVAVNFALAVAQTGRRVALVDANLRAPALHTALGAASDAGLTEALDAGLELDTAAMPSAPGVAFIAAGATTERPAELLDSPRFDALLAQLRERFDLVVFDSPAALDFADASILASKCDGAVVVLRADYSTRDDAARCVELLRRSGTRVVGIVLTQDTGVFRAPALAWLRVTRRTRVEAAAQ
jgi:non-specific protein-tyrosine kinase